MHLCYFIHLQPCGTCVRWNMDLIVAALAALFRRLLRDQQIWIDRHL